jgi:hypothetical protein
VKALSFWLWSAGRRVAALWCHVAGHTWSSMGDEDHEGWFYDGGWGAEGMTRSCSRCDLTEHRDFSVEERGEALTRRQEAARRGWAA